MSKIILRQAQKAYLEVISEVRTQFTAPNRNLLWENHFQSKFQKFDLIEEINLNTELAQTELELYKDASDLNTFLTCSRKHKELLELYAPRFSEDEKVQASAKRVGLKLPKLFGDVEPEVDVKTNENKS